MKDKMFQMVLKYRHSCLSKRPWYCPYLKLEMVIASLEIRAEFIRSQTLSNVFEEAQRLHDLLRVEQKIARNRLRVQERKERARRKHEAALNQTPMLA